MTRRHVLTYVDRRRQAFSVLRSTQYSTLEYTTDWTGRLPVFGRDHRQQRKHFSGIREEKATAGAMASNLRDHVWDYLVRPPGQRRCS